MFEINPSKLEPVQGATIPTPEDYHRQRFNDVMRWLAKPHNYTTGQEQLMLQEHTEAIDTLMVEVTLLRAEIARLKDK